MINLKNNKFKKVGRETLIIITGVLVVIYIVQTAIAGTLFPPGPPTVPTMQDLQEVFDPIASDSYDSSSVLADPDGNALEIIKCIISKLNTGTCP